MVEVFGKLYWPKKPHAKNADAADDDGQENLQDGGEGGEIKISQEIKASEEKQQYGKQGKHFESTVPKSG